MFRTLTATLTVFVLALGLFLTSINVQADDEIAARKEQYKSEPFLRFIPSIPQVMMIIERDWKIFYPAYNNLLDLNGDGSIDIGFNPSITYVGYFDINSCYSHDGQKFYRVGPTTPYTQDQTNADRPVGLKASIPSPVSAHGVCIGSNTTGLAPATWHGNWLNFALTTRIDAIRKVLYGGKRKIDTATETILELSYVPSNAFVFGAEVVSDALWNTHAQDSPWFRSEYFTGLNRPQGKYMHFFARVDHTPWGAHVGRSANPLVRILYNVDSTFKHPVSQNPVRYWDWIYGPNILPDDLNMPSSATKLSLIARVSVCNPNSISSTEGCWRYGNSYKPTGLLQEYGERGNMQFGLITAQMSRTNCTTGGFTAYDTRCNDKGGLLRHHIDKISGVAINSTNGAIIPTGLIATLDKLEISDYVDASQQYHFNSSVNTGNPVGEMVMEALRYFTGANAGLTDYKIIGTELLGLTTANWNNRPPATVTCVKPFILLISDIYPTYDGNNIPSSAQLNAPLLEAFSGTSVPTTWDMPSLLSKITANEGYQATGRKFYYSKTSESFYDRGVCIAKDLPANFSLNSLRGFCPSEPSLSGSYSFAAAAYYARTHDFSKDSRKIPAEFFVVALSPNIPEISISDGKGHQANIMPIVTVAPANSGAYSNSDDTTFVDAMPHTRTLVNFIMKRAQADKNGLVFRLEYMTNFEGSPEPYDIWERDYLNNADVALLTTAATPVQYRESVPYYINSGPFKTTSSSQSANITETVHGVNRTGVKRTATAPGPYYAFKTSEDPNDPTDITQWDVVGMVIVTNSVGSDTSWSAALGYTINGVTRPGAYLDAAAHGNDFRVPTTSNVYPYETALQRKLGIPWGNGALGGGGWPGPHLHVPSIVLDPLLTPWECAYAGDTSVAGRVNCGLGDGSNPTYWSDLYSWNANSARSNVAKKMRYIQVRSFQFAENNQLQPLHFPNPLWLGAKYSGFKDLNTNGVPDPGEWDTIKPGTPDNYFEVANLSELPEKLGSAFDRISRSGDAITATSDSITSVLGGGLALQTSYVPEFIHPMDEEIPSEKRVTIKWVGNLYSLFLDQWGNLREDTNHDGNLDVITGEDISGDLVVRFDKQEDSVKSKVVFLADEKGTNELSTHAKTAKNMYDIDSVWDTSKLMSEMTDENLLPPNSPRPYTSTAKSRRLYAYTGETPDSVTGFSSGVDLKNYLFSEDNVTALTPYLVQGYTLGTPISYGDCTGVAKTNHLSCGNSREVCKQIHFSAAGKPPHQAASLYVEITNSLPAGQVDVIGHGSGLKMRVGRTTALGIVTAINAFIYDNNSPSLIRASLNPGDDGTWVPTSTFTGQLTIPSDSNDSTVIAKELIKYTTGVDVHGWRSRKVCSPWQDTPTEKITWRMGDIINSKPVIVGEPAGSYDLIYGDRSYSSFKKNFTNAEGTLGRRMVAYLGSNDGILHAVNLGFYGSLTDGTIGYRTTSFFDSQPGVAHALGTEIWGYIPTSVLPHLTWLTDPNYAHSYYVDLEPMIIDIKNTTSTNFPLGDGRTWKADQWKTVLIAGLRLGGRTIELDNPSAPARFLYSEYFALDVTNPEEEPVLLWRFSHPNLGLPINKPAVVSSQDGWHVVIGSGPTTDILTPITIDNVTKQVMVPAGAHGEAAYNGLSSQTARLFVLNAYSGALQKEFGGESNLGVEGAAVPANSFFNDSFVPAAVGPGSQRLISRGNNAGEINYWHNNTVYFGLTVSRNTQNLDSGAVLRLQMVDSQGNPAAVNNWKLTTFYNTERPVTGAVNATYDSVGNLWVVFGTGRLWAEQDAAPGCQLLSNSTAKDLCNKNHTQYLFGIKEPMDNGVMTYAQVKETSGRRLADVTKARVFTDGSVTNYDGQSGAVNYEQILEWMRADNYLGYKRGLDTWGYTNDAQHAQKFEMILTQPKIDALPNGRSNLVVTTYEPSNDICNPEGNSFLLLADTYTGIPAPYMASLGFDEPTTPITFGSGANIAHQITGYLDAGRGQATEAWIIKTTAGTDYGSTGANQVSYAVHMDSGNDGFVSGTLWWREVMDMGFSLDPADLEKGLPY